MDPPGLPLDSFLLPLDSFWVHLGSPWSPFGRSWVSPGPPVSPCVSRVRSRTQQVGSLAACLCHSRIIYDILLGSQSSAGHATNPPVVPLKNYHKGYQATPASTSSLHWCPEGTVADIYIYIYIYILHLHACLQQKYVPYMRSHLL